MFGRVAACSVAALLLLTPAASSGEAGIVTEAAAPAVAAAIAPEPAQDVSHDQSQDPNQGETRYLVGNPPHKDIQSEVRVAALDPEEPSIESPAPAAPLIALPVVAEPFGVSAEPIAYGGVVTKWTGVEAGIRAENDILAHCRDNAAACPAAAKSFLAIVTEGSRHTGRARIGMINRAVNLAIRPMTDLAQWGVEDHWSPPLETLTTGRGDCEDYAIAKYVALRAAGVAEADVKLVIVHDTAADQDHAVVAVRLDGGWIVLDNRWLTLIEDHEFPGIVPLFVLDQDGVKIFSRTTPSDTRRASAPASVDF